MRILLRPVLVLLLPLFFLLPALLPAQTPRALGQWEALLSYRRGSTVTQSETEIIYSTGRAVFFLSKEDLSIRRLTKADGLAEAAVRLVKFHPPTGTLIIVYENSVIDLYRPDGRINTLRQIDNFNFSGGDNSINDIFVDGTNTVYLGAGYGVSALDVAEGQEIFLFTTFTAVPVRGVVLLQGQLYAGTDEGLYRVPRQGVNLSDFGNWQLLGAEEGVLPDVAVTAVQVWRNDLYYALRGGDVYRWNNGNPGLHYTAPANQEYVAYLSAGQNYLLAGYDCPINEEATCRSQQLVLLTENGFDREIRGNCVGDAAYAVEDPATGRIFLADRGQGIRYLPGAGSAECDILSYTGPLTDASFSLTHDGTSLWVAAGGYTPGSLSPLFNDQGFFRFKQGDWDFFNRSNEPQFYGRDGILRNDDDVQDIVSSYHNPVTGKLYFGSWLEGFIEYDPATDGLTLYDENNTTLQRAEGDPFRTRVGGFDSDAAGNLYVANHRAMDRKAVTVLTPDGQSAALGGDCNFFGAFDVAVDQAGFIWTLYSIQPDVGGVSVLDPGPDVLDPSDDECRVFLTGNSNLPTNELRSIVVDLDGDVWVGTAAGIVIFECGGSALDDICQGSIRIVEDNEFTGRLLETEDILALAVDGANRKWVGTNSGVYLLSPDGREQIFRFDEGNSPLLSNTVRAITIRQADGTVYFGTENGIISYRGDATLGGEVNKEELEIFPNPVTPDYRGPIAIRGLARDATVKITDVSGKLVFETQAEGGQVTWDGRDYTGREARSGVYLVFAATNGRFRFDNPDGAIGKIVFVR